MNELDFLQIKFYKIALTIMVTAPGPTVRSPYLCIIYLNGCILMACYCNRCSLNIEISNVQKPCTRTIHIVFYSLEMVQGSKCVALE